MKHAFEASKVFFIMYVGAHMQEKKLKQNNDNKNEDVRLRNIFNIILLTFDK